METANLAIMFTLTFLAFGVATWVFSTSQPEPIIHFFLHPLVVGPFLVAIFLILLRIDYQQYRLANEPFFFLLDTAIVALAVPLYQQFYNFRIVAKPLLITLIFSAFFASISAGRVRLNVRCRYKQHSLSSAKISNHAHGASYCRKDWWRPVYDCRNSSANRDNRRNFWTHVI